MREELNPSSAIYKTRAQNRITLKSWESTRLSLHYPPIKNLITIKKLSGCIAYSKTTLLTLFCR